MQASLTSETRTNENALLVSYGVAHRTAKPSKRHTLAESVILAPAVEMAKTFIGEKEATKLTRLLLIMPVQRVV